MRLKTLLRHSFSTIKPSVIIFYSCYMVGFLLSNTAAAISNNITMGVRTDEGNWSFAIISFAIYMLVVNLISSQSDVRFLISRTVTRKEIFVTNLITNYVLAAIMAVLQMVSIAISSLLAYFFTDKLRWLESDFQNLQAPNMRNPLIFFLVSTAILATFGACSYLFGTLLARWKYPTLFCLVVLSLLFLALLFQPKVIEATVNFLQYMFTDTTNGLWIAAKHLLFSCSIFLIAFPVSRKITAAK